MSKTHRFQVGDITCIALEEGTTGYPLERLQERHPNATQDEIESAQTDIAFDEGQIINSFNTLYIETGNTKILIDTGMGINPERSDIGGTIPSLQSEGIQPEDIDIVYITHFHGDHYMGLLRDGKPAFPNARYLTLDDEWHFWMSEETKAKLGERVQGILNVVSPLEDKFNTVSDGDTIAPGVSVFAIPGHTMGQSAIRLESGGESMIHLVDLLHTTGQFRYPGWHFVWDTDAELAVKSRIEHLNKATDNNPLVMFYHLPFPGLGHVGRDGEHFTWTAL